MLKDNVAVVVPLRYLATAQGAALARRCRERGLYAVRRLRAEMGADIGQASAVHRRHATDHNLRDAASGRPLRADGVPRCVSS